MATMAERPTEGKRRSTHVIMEGIVAHQAAIRGLCRELVGDPDAVVIYEYPDTDGPTE